MCGIGGVLGFSEADEFAGMMQALKSRGPDGESAWQEDELRLGHRLLALTADVSDSVQPLAYGPLVIVYNGEIYNHPEIRAELEQAGHRFQNRGDAEVLAAAWLQWGPACLQKLNGMWAFAVYDRRDKKLRFARDRYGKKPLFWMYDGRRLVFASLMRALYPFMKNLELHPGFEALKKDIFEYESAEECLIRGIRRFPAGSWAVWEAGQMHIQRWFDPRSVLREVPRQFGAQVEEFRAILKEAVRIRLRSKHKPGVALSGGLDSTAVLSLVHAVQAPSSQWHPRTFSVAFPGTALDEAAWAKEAAAFYSDPHTSLVCDAEEALRRLPEDIRALEELWISPPSPMMQLYRAMGQAGIRFSMEGHGADELFSGYDTFLLHALKETGLHPLRIHRVLQTYRSLSPPPDARGEDIFRKAPVSWRNYRIEVCGRPEWQFMKGRWITELRKAIEKPRQGLDHEGLNAELFDLFHRANLPALLRNYDRYSMASGIEVRMPFLDPNVVGFALSVPWTSKIRGGYTKMLLREAVAPFAPARVIRRKWKMGFQAPLLHWIRGTWKDWLLDICHSRDFLQSDSVRGAELRDQLNGILQNPGAAYRDAEIFWTGFYPWLWQREMLQR